MKTVFILKKVAFIVRLYIVTKHLVRQHAGESLRTIANGISRFLDETKMHLNHVSLVWSEGCARFIFTVLEAIKPKLFVLVSLPRMSYRSSSKGTCCLENNSKECLKDRIPEITENDFNFIYAQVNF